MGEECKIERFGTDGDMKRMIALIQEYDGKVDALAWGSIFTFLLKINAM